MPTVGSFDLLRLVISVPGCVYSMCTEACVYDTQGSGLMPQDHFTTKTKQNSFELRLGTSRVVMAIYRVEVFQLVSEVI